jgi:NAD(P)-dependent dehydrogenase (short-subunit alcohol dehydrogenase family)
MDRKVFLAGATGAIGKRLVPLLLDARYEVFATTRSESKAARYTAPEPDSTRPTDRLCTSTRLRTRRCSPSKEPNRGFSISPRTPAMSQLQKRAASLAGIQAFV